MEIASYTIESNEIDWRGIRIQPGQSVKITAPSGDVVFLDRRLLEEIQKFLDIQKERRVA